MFSFTLNSVVKTLSIISFVVVLPFDPVTAITLGFTYLRYALAKSCNALSVSSTQMIGPSISSLNSVPFSENEAPAPSFKACATNRWPSTFSPLNGIKAYPFQCYENQ